MSFAASIAILIRPACQMPEVERKRLLLGASCNARIAHGHRVTLAIAAMFWLGGRARLLLPLIAGRRSNAIARFSNEKRRHRGDPHRYHDRGVSCSRCYRQTLSSSARHGLRHCLPAELHLDLCRITRSPKRRTTWREAKRRGFYSLSRLTTRGLSGIRATIVRLPGADLACYG